MIINFTISLICNSVSIVYELSLYCAARNSFSINLNFACRSERAKRRVIRDFYCDVNPRASKQTGKQRGSVSHKKGQVRLDVPSITALFLYCYVSVLLNKLRWQKF